MKKIVFLFSIVFMLISCSVDTDENFQYVTLPVESVDIPTEFELGETYNITVRYYRPTTCHAFDSFYYEKNLNIRTVAVQNVIFSRNNCENLDSVLVEETLQFSVTNTGNYIFKFWTGEDSEGNDTFLEYDIPVI